MLNFIKQQWQIISDREKKLAMMGGIFIATLFVYLIFWCPLSDLVSHDKLQFQNEKKLLLYLQQASQEIHLIQASGIQLNVHDNENLLALAEQTLSQAKLSMYLKQVQQPHQSQITLTFHRAPFQRLMQWLQIIISTQGVQIQEFHAMRLSTSGAVNAVVVLNA